MSDFHQFLVANPDIHTKLVNIFKINPGKGLSVDYIVKNIGLNARFVEQVLHIWEQHPCTFFSDYGKVVYRSKLLYHTTQIIFDEKE